MHRIKPSVSLVMIVRDEAQHLADCLTPVAPLMDEIVIADTGSRDCTRQIASRFTSQVFDFPWCDDFSAARNAALRRSTGDYVFWLDADDRLSPSNLASFSALLAQLTDRPRCYFMDTVSRRQFACEGTQLHSHPRLFRRHSAFHWRGHVHEQLRPELTQLGYESVWTDIQIDHLGYQVPAELQRKQRRNLRLLAMDYAIDPTDPSTILHLGLAHAEIGNKNEARKFLHQALASQTGASHLRRVYLALADLAMREGEYQQVLAVLAQGLLHFPLDEGLLYQQAETFENLGRFPEAQHVLEQLINTSELREHHGGLGEIRSRLAPRKIAELFALQGRFEEASRRLKLLLTENPDDACAWYLLGSISISGHDKSDLDAICSRLQSCPQGSYFAAALQAGWYLWRKQPAPAIEHIDWLIAALPDAPLARNLRCQALALQNAPPAARLQAWRDVLRVEPGNQIAARELQSLQHAQHPVAYSDGSGWQSSVVCDPGIAVG